MVQVRVVRTKDGTPGKDALFRPQTMLFEDKEIQTKEQYDKFIQDAFAEFKNNTDLFTVNIYNTKGLVKSYAYEDINYADYECDCRVIDFELLEETRPMTEWDDVEKMRKYGFNV